MEPKDLDKIFKDRIEKDASDFSYEELQSKEEVWGALDINSEKEQVAKRSLLAWWPLALVASLLFLIFGASAISIFDKMQIQNSHYATMEKEYKSTLNELKQIKNQLQQLDKKLEQQNSQIATSATKENKEEIEAPKIVETKYIEQVVYKTDTIYSIQQIVQAAIPERIIDTLYIKEAIAPENSDTETIAEKINLEEKNIVETKQPRKVEFILGKKSMSKPKSLDVKFQINGAELAKKKN